jgi:general secretion pathway protein H
MAKISPTGLNSIRLNAGVTLIEVLVVLTIMAMVVSSISYVALNKKESLKDLTMSIVQNMRLTRQQSIREGLSQQFVINLSENTFEFSETLIELPEDVSITVNTAENQLLDKDSVGISFYPDASSSGGKILLESAKQSFRILIVWISGKVSMSATGETK